MSEMEEKYNKDGWLIVSELGECPFFERNPSVSSSYSRDCYFCRFSDFRRPDYIEAARPDPVRGELYGICHNENNKNKNI